MIKPRYSLGDIVIWDAHTQHPSYLLILSVDLLFVPGHLEGKFFYEIYNLKSKFRHKEQTRWFDEYHKTHGLL